jgi:hypothetical protein
MDLKTVGARGWRLLIKKLPSWPYLALALAVAIVGHYLSELEIVAPLRALTVQLLADLQVISPLNMMGAYYAELTGCSVAYADGAVSGACDTNAVGRQMTLYGLSGISTVFWPVVVLLKTAIVVWDTSGWMGRIIYLATLPVGGIAAIAAVDKTGDTNDEWTVFGWVLFAALLPLFAGAVALVLQGCSSSSCGSWARRSLRTVWGVTVAAGPIAYARHGFSLMKEAKELEEGHATLKGE